MPPGGQDRHRLRTNSTRAQTEACSLPSKPRLCFLAVEIKAVEEFVWSRGSMHQNKTEKSHESLTITIFHTEKNSRQKDQHEEEI